MVCAFIALGSNIRPREHIRAALFRLGRQVRITRISTFYGTDALGDRSQPAFINGVVAVETSLSPPALKFGVLRSIEAALGRVRTADRYAPRTIDLDLLLYDAMVCKSPEITLPDPDIPDRPFLAVPLCELAPELILPGTGVAIKRLSACHEDHTMRPLSAYTAELREALAHGLPEGGTAGTGTAD